MLYILFLSFSPNNNLFKHTTQNLTMCWSGPASGAFGILGVVSAIYMYKKGWDKALWIPILFFSLMEFLQFGLYFHLGECDVRMNQILTFLGYIHISLQVVFINMFSMHFIPKRVRAKIYGVVYTFAFAGVIMLLMRLYPFNWAGACEVGVSTFCGPQMCSVPGQWHLAFEAPLNGLSALTWVGYTFMAFVLPMLYGSWRMTAYHLLIGPGLASLLTNNPNEFAAVWCLISISYILLIFITPLRRSLHVKKWYFWNYPKFKSKKSTAPDDVK